MKRSVQGEDPSLPEVGEVVGERFEILDELGSGGMGHVYRVNDRQRHRQIALKLIVPRYIGRHDREERFFREATLGQRMRRHPHIVEILESGRLGDRAEWPFIAMELVEGRGLPTHLVLHGPMTPRRACTIARQVVGAIDEMHANGVVHRDISTTNVILQDEGVVLIDFSHAGDLRAPRVAAGVGGRLTQPHDMIGTHTCMAPEQARAEPPSTTMDVYAFGIMLFELLTGHNPYEGTTRDTLLPQLVEGTLQPPRVKDASVHPTLAEIVHACTQLDPAKRPSMRGVGEQLDLVMAAMGMPISTAMAAVNVPTGSDLATSEAASRPAAHAGAANAHGASPATPPGRWRLIAFVAIPVAFALLLVIRSWAPWSSEPEPAVAVTDGTTGAGARGGAEESTTGRSPVIVAAAESESDNVSETSVGTTGAVELQPDDESTGDEPSPPPTSDPPPPQPKRECGDDPARAAKADAAQRWGTVVKETRHAKCWRRDPSRRLALRARALFNLHRYRECASLPKRHANMETVRMITICESMTEHGKGAR